MQVHQFINTKLTSNTYLITTAKSPGVWLVDLGAFDLIRPQLSSEQYIAGVLLTHYHYDHIYGINQLLWAYPQCKIFASGHTIEGLYSSKLNLSFYHDEPIVYKGSNTVALSGSEEVLLWDTIHALVISTPGHNPGCLTFKIGNFLFTGDSYIPGLKVVTKLKGGNKVLSEQSLQIIKNLIAPDTIVCPGHGKMVYPPYEHDL